MPTGTLAARRWDRLQQQYPLTVYPVWIYIAAMTQPKPADPESLLPLPPATFHVLLALAGRDRHGYGIILDVEARTDGALRLSPGTLYRTIQRLLEQGLIVEPRRRASAQDDPRRRYYRITPFGMEVAGAETRRLAQMVRFARGAGFLTPKAT